MKTLTTRTPSKLAQQPKSNPSHNIEVLLTQFIRWALKVTASGECTGDMAIALLDQAWTAQKMLWSLRNGQNAISLSTAIAPKKIDTL